MNLCIVLIVKIRFFHSNPCNLCYMHHLIYSALIFNLPLTDSGRRNREKMRSMKWRGDFMMTEESFDPSLNFPLKLLSERLMRWVLDIVTLNCYSDLHILWHWWPWFLVLKHIEHFHLSDKEASLKVIVDERQFLFNFIPVVAFSLMDRLTEQEVMCTQPCSTFGNIASNPLYSPPSTPHDCFRKRMFHLRIRFQ